MILFRYWVLFESKNLSQHVEERDSQNDKPGLILRSSQVNDRLQAQLQRAVGFENK